MHSIVTDTHLSSGSVSMTIRKELTPVLGEVLPQPGRSHAKVLHMWLIRECIRPPWETTRMWDEGRDREDEGCADCR